MNFEGINQNFNPYFCWSNNFFAVSLFYFHFYAYRIARLVRLLQIYLNCDYTRHTPLRLYAKSLVGFRVLTLSIDTDLPYIAICLTAARLHYGNGKRERVQFIVIKLSIYFLFKSINRVIISIDSIRKIEWKI